MQRSRLCLCPPGDVPYNKRYFTALLAGCVPVLFSFPSQLKGERKKQAAVVHAAADVVRSHRVSEGVHSPKMSRMLTVAIARGAAAEKAAAKERRGAKRTQKKQSSQRGKVAKRAARRRKAAGL